MPSPRTPSPTPYDQERAYLIPKERPRDSRQPEGPPWQLWVIVVLVCVISGYWLALELYTPPPQYHCTPSGQHLAPEPGGPAEITAVGHRDLNASEQLSLDLVGLFATANSAIKVGAIASGVNEFNQHVSTCDQHNWRPCLTSLISGLLLTAASHHRAPIPAIRIVPFEDLIISIDQFDDTSTHPAHLFISNYREVVERDPSFGTARIGYIHYVNLGLRRHRLVIQPRSTGIGRRGDKNRSGDDNGSVSYEWTDFASNKGVDINKADYDMLAGNVANYLVENKSNNICLTQCIGSLPYGVGQLRTQATRSSPYDPVCEFADEMMSCT